MLFAHPEYFWLFLIYIPLIAWYIWKRRHLVATMAISTTSPFAGMRKSWKGRAWHLLFILQLAAIGFLIVVIARPQTTSRWRSSSTEGTNIVIAMDVSTSMLAKDFEPNRLEAAKRLASEFVSGREHDNMGLVIFAGESFSPIAMTTDRAMLSNYIQLLKTFMIEDGTAIGDGIATAINRIKDGKAKSKSIILITDGTNNCGNVAPRTAAEIAAKYGIKVYTIGVGTKGNAPTPVGNVFGQITYENKPVTIDENALTEIAQVTGGKYFRATDNSTLSSIFEEIDQLEKTEIDVKNFTNTDDDFMIWGWLALGCLALSMLLRFTVFRSIP